MYYCAKKCSRPEVMVLLRSLPATLPILFLCEISFLLGHGLIMTLLGVRMSLEGFSSQMAGLFQSAFR